jgi:hypothetical protein
MFAIPRLRLLGALLIGSALAVLLALVAYLPAAQANHSWGKYHWARTSNPFTLKLGNNLSSGWGTYLNVASSDAANPDWSDSSVLNTTVVPGQTTGAKCAPTSGRVEVCNAAYGTNGWLGVAQIWIGRRNHIVAGTTKVNDTYFSTATYNTPAWKQLVMCQEVGHTFGLDHQDERFNNPNLGSCMDYTNDPDGGTGGASASDPSNLYPNQHDYAQLALIYSHLDKTTTVDTTSASSQLPPAANQVNFNRREEWGQKIQESPNGQLALYERDFDKGKRVFTFVIWAQ